MSIRKYNPRSTKRQTERIQHHVRYCMTLLYPREKIASYVNNQPQITAIDEHKLIGLSETEAREYLSTLPRINLTLRQIDHYISAVNGEWTESKDGGREAKRNGISNTLKHIASKAIEKGQYRTAIKAISQYCKIWGLNQPQKFELDANIKEAKEYTISWKDLNESYSKLNENVPE